MCADLLEGKQPLLCDGLDNIALGNAIAAANLGVVAHGGYSLGLAVPGASEMGLPKEKLFMHAADIGTVTHELGVPGAVQRVAVQHGPPQAAVGNDQLLVYAADAVLYHQRFGLLTAVELARREQVDAADLELRRRE